PSLIRRYDELEGQTQSRCCQQPKGLSLSEVCPPLSESNDKGHRERQKKRGLITKMADVIEPWAVEGEEHRPDRGRDHVEIKHAAEKKEARDVVEKSEKNERHGQGGKHVQPRQPQHGVRQCVDE